MASYDKAIESYKKTITTAASVAASLMLVRGVVNELVPYEVRDLLFSGLGYLATRINTNLQQRLRISSMDEDDKIMVSMAEGDEMADMYEGTEFKWCLICHDNSSDSSNNGYGGHQEVSYEVSFHKKHKETALKSYLPFILATAKAINDQERTLRIFMNEYSDTWSPIDLHHPSTFDTLAMDQKLKQSIIDDLNRFIKRKDYYKRIGKAWKRGYLLYGPSGTGKSSLVAAIANHLRFDIYDLELTQVSTNSDLRRLLIGMTNRSILVVEDIDCSIEMNQREESRSNPIDEEEGEHKVTLSGLLNFADGLWSTIGEGKIIIFTTNYKERLDPALLRPGRMDMHIQMGYCTPESFRILANNYHSIEYHATYPKIEELIKEVMATPAEVAEVLTRNDDSDVAFHDLVNLLESKMKDAHEIDTGHKDKRRRLDKKDDSSSDEN